MAHQQNRDQLEVEFRRCDFKGLIADLRSQDIYFRHSLYGTENSIRPSDHDWEIFWRSIDELDLWSWAPDYSNTSVLDGFSWSIKLAHGSKSVCSEGSNGYPGQSIDRAEPSEVFRQFRVALQQLIPDASEYRPD